jgi:drug/metabolite transporter (DMT)-like permease
LSIRVSPISKWAAIIIVFLGLFLLVGGVASAEDDSIVAGVAVTVLGVVLYSLLFRFARKVQRELDEGAEASPSAAAQS